MLWWISECLNRCTCVTSSERDPFLEAGLLGPRVKYSKMWRWCSTALQKRQCKCAFPPTVCGETQLHYFLADVGYYWSLKNVPSLIEKCYFIDVLMCISEVDGEKSKKFFWHVIGYMDFFYIGLFSHLLLVFHWFVSTIYILNYVC